MTNDELKKKMCDTIMRIKGYSILQAEQIADALIAAGIGDISEWKAYAKVHRIVITKDDKIKQLYSDEEVDKIVSERADISAQCERLKSENAELRAELEEYEMIERRKERISQHRREDVRRVADKITRCCLTHCGHKVRIEAQDGFCIETCTYPPYHGKWIVEIEQCPKADETREAAEARLAELKGGGV